MWASLKCRRRGTTAVEAAVVLPVFIAFIFAILQIGHIAMVETLLQHACRTAARHGATEGVTTAEAIAAAEEAMRAGVPMAATEIIVRDAAVYDTTESLPQTAGDFDNLPAIELQEAPTRRLFLIRATVSYNDVALLSLPWTKNLRLTGQAFMRHE